MDKRAVLIFSLASTLVKGRERWQSDGILLVRIRPTAGVLPVHHSRYGMGRSHDDDEPDGANHEYEEVADAVYDAADGHIVLIHGRGHGVAHPREGAGGVGCDALHFLLLPGYPGGGG